MRKKYFLVFFKPGRKVTTEGHLGDGRCLIDCFGMCESPTEYRFIYGYHTDTVNKEEVLSCREISREEAEQMR